MANRTDGKDFDFTTVKNFDDHIINSISGYSILPELIASLVSFHLYKGATVLDIGCSSGKLLADIKAEHDVQDVTYLGVDITDNLFIRRPGIQLKVLDATRDVLPACDVAISVFTLQFIDYKLKPLVVRKIYDALPERGVLIICEKTYPDSPKVFESFEFSNYDFKRKSFTSDDILGKQLSLRNKMKLLSEYELLDTFRNAGFAEIVKFFQCLNFNGYLCFK